MICLVDAFPRLALSPCTFWQCFGPWSNGDFICPGQWFWIYIIQTPTHMWPHMWLSCTLSSTLGTNLCPIHLCPNSPNYVQKYTAGYCRRHQVQGSISSPKENSHPCSGPALPIAGWLHPCSAVLGYGTIRTPPGDPRTKLSVFLRTMAQPTTCGVSSMKMSVCAS